MKVGKKLGINNEQINKLVKVKDHTRTWIKNVEKAAKVRNEFMSQPVVNLDYQIQAKSPTSQGVFQVTTPLQYLPNLPASYSCSFCGVALNTASTATVQYHEHLSYSYVLLCRTCADKG